MARSKKIVELYINNQLYKSVPYNRWDSESRKLSHILRMKGYHEQYDDLEGFDYPSIYAHVWINWKSQKILITSHKIRTEYTDKKGNVLYEDDTVRYNDGDYVLTSEFNAKPFEEGYYIREYIPGYGGGSWRDTNISPDNIKYVTKVKDNLGFPKKFWNDPEKFDMNTL